MKKTTLSALVEEYGANAFVLADAGNGSSYGEKGRLVNYDKLCRKVYGNTAMHKLKAPHMSDDGSECEYASDWIIQGDGDNQYRVRIYF